MAQQYRLGKTTTAVTRENGATRVVYHSTAVVEFTDRRIVLRSGGWRTATTKTRMNQAAAQFGLPYRVSQKAGRWYVAFGGQMLPFSDGMVLDIY